jgi:hypothetical protein
MIAGLYGGDMRFFLGIIFGVLLTVAVSFILDSGAEGVQQRPMVNWDVVAERLNALTADIQRVWANFTREITGPR